MAREKKNKKEVETEAHVKVKKPHRPFYDASRGLHRLLPCIYLTVGVLLGVFFALEALDKNAVPVSWCLDVLFGLFGYAAYAIPALLLMIAIRWRIDIERHRAISRVVYYLLFMIMIEAVIWCFTANKEMTYTFGSFFSYYYTSNYGIFGGGVALLLFKLTKYVGVPLFTTALVGMFCYHFLELTPYKVVSYIREKRAERRASEAETATETSEVSVEPAEGTEEPVTVSIPREEAIKPPKKKKPSRAEKRAARRAEKEARRAAAPAHDEHDYEDGYFPAPAATSEESFSEIHQRMEREAREIERENREAERIRAREEILGHSTAAATDAPAAAEAAVAEEDDYFTPVAPAYPTAPTHEPVSDRTPATTAHAPSQNADAVFGTFDPLAGDAVINTTSTILRPAGVPNETRRESVRPVTPRRESFHSVPGGVQGSGESVGSFYIRPTPHKPTAAPPPAETTSATEDPSATVTDAPDTEGRPLSDFEQMTHRTDNENQTPSQLPYVHPATQPGTQPQPQIPTGVPQGYPYAMPGAPYGQMPYPPMQPPYPGYPYPGYPAQPYPQYPGYPYAGYPQTPTAPTAPETVASPAAPEIKIEQHSDVSDENAVEATAHVVEHHVNADVPVTPAAPAAAASSAAPPRPQVTKPVEEPVRRAAPTYENYHFPPLSLLNANIPITNLNTEAEVEETSARLVNEFRKFKHNVEVKEVTVGPRVTRYCIAPPDGVRINTLTNLSNDIALGLAVKSIRIEPVPNTPYLGVEIPNKTPTTVHLSSLIGTENFRNTKTVTTIPIGASVTGQPVFADIAKMPHVLIAGATGMGKSVFMNSLLLSLLYKARPDEVKLILVDPKRVELSVYNGIPHLIIPTVVEPQKAAGALIWAVGEMERRYHLMEKYGTRSIESYNEFARKDPSIGEPQPKIIIVIDELNDLMMQARDAVEPAIMSIAQKARAAGIYLIIGTQRPSVDVITGVIKANIPSRIAFHVSSGTDSRTILDTYGAEKLLNNGDMLASISGAEPIRMQGAFVADEEVERVTKFLKDNAGPAVYDEVINAQIESETEKYKNSGKRQSERDGEDEEVDGSIFEDSKFMEACNVAFESGKISTSLLQRRCSIGYGKAAKYIDIMESMGIVSAPDGQKPREVLMTRDQFMEMVSRESYTGDD